ncbi:6-phosphogluconolactonase [Klugiella xanthotipulae]|uniref:6-phosphogluconolactonase n=1 Tax=Klugiella xanthotipulae TaxID=244735 RepID=A0A543HSP1_9MICO|nr:6-phosphogluconolactonase [Klugiella xanthotipulae]TQM61352.1 6-phosphogluconolactonase [Klugiella xanthotipulae]
MTIQREIRIHTTVSDVAEAVAGEFISVVGGVQRLGKTPRVVLTGGTLGIAVLRATAQHPAAASIEWNNVDLFWGDERWLPDGDAERNDEQAREAFLAPLAIGGDRVYRCPSPDSGLDLDQAVARYASDISWVWEEKTAFDLVFLGVGPDAHIASIFPGRTDLVEATEPVIGVRNSPKPPPERLSLSRVAINRAARVWLLISGEAKREAYAHIINDDDALVAPAASVEGQLQTIVFADTVVSD